MAVGDKVRCKLYVTKTENFLYPKGSKQVSLSAVYKSGGSEGNAVTENHIFGKATPTASLQVLIQNPEAAKAFEPGKSFYVDFIETEPDFE